MCLCWAPGAPSMGTGGWAGAETGTSPVTTHFSQCLKSKAPMCRHRSHRAPAAPEKGGGRGTAVDLPPGLWGSTSSPHRCLLDSTGVGRRGDQCIVHTQGHLRNPTP